MKNYEKIMREVEEKKAAEQALRAVPVINNSTLKAL